MLRQLFLTFLCLFSFSAYAGFYDINYLKSLTKSQAETAFDPFAQLVAHNLNSGLGDPMNVGTFKLGAEIVVTPFDDKGFLADAPVSYLPVPYLYAGLSFADIVLFGRVSTIPIQSGGQTPTAWGGGAGMKFKFAEIFSLTPVLTYHRLDHLDQIHIWSMSAQVQANIDLMFIQLFGNTGVSYTHFSTDFAVSGETEKFSYSKTLFHLGGGIKKAFAFTEFGVLPERSITIGGSFGF